MIIILVFTAHCLFLFEEALVAAAAAATV